MTTQTPPPDFDADRAHYGLPIDFFRCCLDANMCYSCAYFATGKETLEEAQIAKIDRALTGLELKPGERLLEIGSGWGATGKRAAEKYGADYTGITLSVQHCEHGRQVTRGLDNAQFHIEGWETYDRPCDKIVSFGAFEHFTSPKYPAFFEKCRSLLPPGGLLFVQTITHGRLTRALSFARHVRFMVTDVFPKAEIPRPEEVVRTSREQGFELLHMESLRFHYAQTLEHWAANLERNREAAVRTTDEAIYAMFIRYFKDSAAYYRSGEAGAHNFLLQPF